MLFLFDRGLIAMGNVRGLLLMPIFLAFSFVYHHVCFVLQLLFLAGLATTIGFQSTVAFFSKRKNRKASHLLCTAVLQNTLVSPIPHHNISVRYTQPMNLINEAGAWWDSAPLCTAHVPTHNRRNTPLSEHCCCCNAQPTGVANISANNKPHDAVVTGISLLPWRLCLGGSWVDCRWPSAGSIWLLASVL